LNERPEHERFASEAKESEVQDTEQSDADGGVIGLHAFPVGIHCDEYTLSSLIYSTSYSGFDPPPLFLGDSMYQ
jgi:hypothetical protein